MLAHTLTWHELHRACHMREVRAIELRSDAVVERRTRERKCTRLGSVEDEPAECRHCMGASTVGADELQVDRLFALRLRARMQRIDRRRPADKRPKGTRLSG